MFYNKKCDHFIDEYRLNSSDHLKEIRYSVELKDSNPPPKKNWNDYHLYFPFLSTLLYSSSYDNEHALILRYPKKKKTNIFLVFARKKMTHIFNVETFLTSMFTFYRQKNKTKTVLLAIYLNLIIITDK